MADTPFPGASRIALPPQPALIKVSLPRAGSMLLTDTFHAAGRSAMILDEAPVRPVAARVPGPGTGAGTGGHLIRDK